MSARILVPRARLRSRHRARVSHYWRSNSHLGRYMYEIAQSDKDPLSYMIFERYRSKQDYTGPHRRSLAFLKFRPQMKALQEVRWLLSHHDKQIYPCSLTLDLSEWSF